jgi:hypothetical protein
MMPSIPFAGGTSHDPRQDALCHRVAVLREDNLSDEVSDRPLRAQSSPCISLGGRTAAPGLIDAPRRRVLSGVRLRPPGRMPVMPIATGGSLAEQAIMRAWCFVKHAP